MMNCSWSTICNPGNLLRALWDCTVFCWRRLRILCIRLRSTEVAPTEERIEAFQSQYTQNVDHLRRQLSLQARDGSASSSMHDSTLSEFSPSNEAFSIPETVSEATDNSGPSSPGEQAVRIPSNEQGGQVQPDTPLLRRASSQRSLEQSSTSSGSALNQSSDPSDRTYRTF